MIIDLSMQEIDCSREADVLIVGAGVAGLVLATRLRSNNARIVVLESGGTEQSTDVHPFNQVVQLGGEYSGATRGRFRCLGGTSTRWGGALIPFADHDLGARPYLGLSGFPVAIDEIRRYVGSVERLFGLEPGTYEEDYVQQINGTKYIPTGDEDFTARFAKWPHFKRRNVATLFKNEIRSDPELEVWINATATDFNLDKENGRIQSVVARGLHNRSITVTARHFVLCAGAIESTRLMLLLDHQHGGRIFNGRAPLGRFLNDHISRPMARINPRNVTRLNRMAAFRLKGSTMRSLRFELSPAAQERNRVGNGFAHISFKTEKSTGFDALRDLLRSQQASGHIKPAAALAVLRDVPYLVRLGLWRYLYGQLLWPSPAIYELHVVVEQQPRPENCITLSSKADCFGRPLAAIRWQVTDDDCTAFVNFMKSFDRFWNRKGLTAIGDLEWFYALNSANVGLPHDSSDVYHPGGTTRMGTDRSDAVVDRDLKVFEVPNLWISSTSTFPSGGGANPTLTLMLFTMRLADRLHKVLANAHPISIDNRTLTSIR